MTTAAAQRLNTGEELVRRLASAIRASQLYAPTHPLVTKSGIGLTELLTSMLGNVPSLTIGIVGDDLVGADTPIPNAVENLGELMRRLGPTGVRGLHQRSRRRTRGGPRGDLADLRPNPE